MIAPQPFFRARGTPFSVLHRIRALVERGHVVDLVTYPFGENVELDGLTIYRAAKPPLVSDVRIGPSLAKLALDIPLYRKTVRTLRDGMYDVIHSHEEAAFFCVGLARKFHVPHIYDMHSSLPQQLANFRRFDLKPVRAIFERLENRVLSTCDGVITICEDLARIVQAKCPATPHAMIENTANDQKVFRASAINVRTEIGQEDGEIVLYTGNFEAYQGLDLLTDAFRQVARARPKAHLLLVGGNPEQVVRYRDSLTREGLQNRVTLVGTVHPSEIPGYITAADLLVSPRISGTNTPLKIYGYMRSGRPIVATNRWTHTQTLSETTAELVPPTVNGLAAGIIRLLSNKERCRLLAENARGFAEKEFSDSAYADKISDLYAQSMKGKTIAAHRATRNSKEQRSA